MKHRVVLSVAAVLCPLLPDQVRAQVRDTAVRVGSINGFVRDSIAHAPLNEATVQVVASDNPARFSRTATSDSLGRFLVSDVPSGKYTIGFFHPLLDSIGVQAPLSEVYVSGNGPVRADLAVPSARRLRSAICKASGLADAGAVVVGIVRDADHGTPAAGVTVTGEWLEYSFRREGLLRKMPHLSVTTGENGWFAICNVPSEGTITLVANRGIDSTDVIEVNVPAEGFIRRELFIGSSRTVVAEVAPPRGDNRPPSRRRLHFGDGRLSGTVHSVIGERPLAGALVAIVGGPHTTANERGEWALQDAPSGTRMLEVRAVGYYPERRHVNVVAGAQPLRVSLSTLKSVLDTVRISASRTRGRDLSGFYRRQRRGVGRYITPEEIVRKQAILTSDLFRLYPGMRVEADSAYDRHIMMRSAFGDCWPTIYIDNQLMDSLTMGELDVWVHPQEIAGIEVYVEGTVPPEFQPAQSGCGSVIIWTK